MDVNTIIAIIRAFLKGCIDSLKGSISLFYLDRKINEKAAYERKKQSELGKRKKSHQPSQIKDGKVLTRILQCCGLNGGVFWFSLILFEYVLIPSLNYLLMRILGQSTIATTVWTWSRPLLSLTFGALWVVPIFLISKLVNTLWFQDIADSAFWCTAGKAPFFTNLSKFFADTVFSLIIQSLFLFQVIAVGIGFLPFGHLSQVISLIHISMLYSLYAFEYKWCKIGWELHKRLLFIETNWAYFIGFGLPLSIITALPQSYVVSACVFSILFPLFIISANEAKPVTKVCDTSLPLFKVVIALSNAICNKTLKRATLISPNTSQKKIKR
ncbi:hypothetical protein PGB90_008465 [Kerria lacca]